MIPYSRLKLSDLYTLSKSEQLENQTLYSGTYLYGRGGFTKTAGQRASLGSMKGRCYIVTTSRLNFVSRALSYSRGLIERKLKGVGEGKLEKEK